MTRFAELPTGPELGVQLASVDVGAVPDETLLDVLAAQWRQLAYQQAQTWAVMAEIARRDPQLPNTPNTLRWTEEQIFESAVDEVRAELLLTRRAARRELEHADAVTALPAVAAALAAGLIDRARAIVLADGCHGLTAAQTDKLIADVLPGAAEVTATGLADRVRRVALALDPAWAERRYRAAVRERRLVAYLNDDGTATVTGQSLPAEQAAYACARVDALAGRAKRAGAAAPIDHLRADLFLGLLDGSLHGLTEAQILDHLLNRHPHADAPTPISRRGVHVRIALGALLGLDDAPGEIAGLGVVIAPVAREVVASQRRAEWRFAILDGSGHLLFDGITRHRPDDDTPTEQSHGGIVELHVPITLANDTSLAQRFPAWARVLTDLRRQLAGGKRVQQDPTARFPGNRLRRHSEINFARCVFRGCRRPASQCDQDHRIDHAKGGRTDADNLQPACAHDNQLKNTGGWRMVRRGPRTFVWISPLGRKHVVPMPPVSASLPEPAPRQFEQETAYGPDPPPS